MHVAINAWFWNKANTGSGQYLRNLLTAIAKLKQDVTISLIMPPDNPEPDGVPDGVTIVPTGNAKSVSKFGKVLFEQRTFPNMATKINADLAHVPYWGSPLSASLPVIVSVLDVIPLLYPVYATGFFNRLYVSLVSAAARNADHILTISHTSAYDIEQELDIARDDITVTYLAQDMRFNPRVGAEHDDKIREKYNLPDQFVLGGFGFDARKNVNELLLAYTYVSLAEGSNAPLILAGKQPDWTQPVFPDLPEYIQRLNLEEHVQWIGYVDETDKPGLYRLADVFAFPSEYEGFGLPALEAMACGTPVVAWNSVVADEVLEAGAYLVNDAREMGGAILSLLLQKPLRDTMTNEGLAQSTKYSWRQTAIGTLQAYDKVVKNS